MAAAGSHLRQPQTTSSTLLHLKLATAMRSILLPGRLAAHPAGARGGEPAAPKCCWSEMLNRCRALTAGLADLAPRSANSATTAVTPICGPCATLHAYHCRWDKVNRQCGPQRSVFVTTA